MVKNTRKSSVTKAQLGWALSHTTIKVGMRGLAIGILRRSGERSRKAGLSDERSGPSFSTKDVNQSEAETQPSCAA